MTTPSLCQITVQDLQQKLSQGSEFLQLVDVREPWEVETAGLPGFLNLPLSQAATWAETIQTRLDPNAETLVLCHHGVRSAQMCQWLMLQGFTDVKNIAGGIDAYAQMVDGTVLKY